MAVYKVIFPDFKIEEFELGDGSTVADLKAKISEAKQEFSGGNFKLQYRGVELKMEQRLGFLRIVANSFIEVHKQKADPFAKFNL